ncbi:MAG: ABC transporter permease [Cyclobacteriaceae bacterium]
MFFNYLKTAYRSLLRSKVFSFINILGLATGLTCALLILTFVIDETSYDNFHSKKERIYRLRYFISDFDIGRVPPVFKEKINDFFPEVEHSTRLWSRSVSISVPSGEQDLRFEEDNVNFADAELFEIFDFELVNGTLVDALTQPNTVILNREVALKYFNSTDVVGKMIYMEGDHSFRVTAVVEDFPTNSHTHFDMLVSYDDMYTLEPESLQEPIKANFKLNHMVSHSPTYVLLKEGSTPEAVNERFKTFVTEVIPEGQQKGQSFEIQPLLDIHLNDNVAAQSEPPGSLQFIWIFIAIGSLTILIACINFVNLSTAKSLHRAKEIGMRKVLGAWNNHLVSQFLGESLLTTFFAALLSLLAFSQLLPVLNYLTDKELNISMLSNTSVVVGFVLIVIFTGILAGIYPAFFVTRFSVLRSLKGSVSDPGSAMNIRKGLMVVQFAISILLISGSLIVFDQLSLVRNKPLGFQKDLILTLPIQSNNFNSVFGGVNETLLTKLETFENTIAQSPYVVGSTLSSGVPGFGMVNRNVIPEGFTAEDNMLSPVMSVDYDFLDLYQIELAEGRSFDKSYGTDIASSFLVNEKALEAFDFGTPQEALGKKINIEGKEGKVVGVVKDFHFLNLTEPIRQIIMEISTAQYNTVSIKLTGQNLEETVAEIEHTWNEIFPAETFDPNYLDQALADSYIAQEQFGEMVGYFSFLAILISCMGSYGLIMFVATEKKKEVGVRKVLGASALQIVVLLAKRFVYLVLISIIIAVPAVLYFGNQWLSDFSYRVDISPWSIGVAALVTIVMVIGTISIQAFLAAMANPVKSLRSE